MKKRARLTEDNDPLTSSDEVLVGIERAGKSAGRQEGKSGGHKYEKPVLRKSTFQLEETLIQALDTFHLQLQIKMGKANAPFKAVIVEEAIARLLASSDQAEVLAALEERQRRRY